MPMFKDENEFSLYIENLQIEQKLDSIIETVLYFYENETDQEMEDIVKLFNRRLRERIEVEAIDGRMVADKTKQVRLW